MKQTKVKKTATHLKVIFPEKAKTRLVKNGGRGASGSPQTAADLIPYSAKELRYMWTLWDEAQRRQQHGLRYRNIYVAATGAILTGWLIYGMGLPLSAPLGGILALAGALVGVWYSLKSLLQQRQSGPKG